MVILIIVLSVFILASIGFGMLQSADGAQAIDEEETKDVEEHENNTRHLIFSSGGPAMLSEVEGDYSHIRI